MEDTADLEQLLLAPLPGNSPAGEDLRWDEAFTLIKEARRTDDPGDLWPGSKQKVADWQEVRRLCTEALATRSKDLQLAAWLAEALVHDRGFEGMASGLGLIYALMDRY
ncbi:MAG: type VI secretion system ImpA family N-terminal domain-containing protein, partial [Candidatus Solibacter sp.]|nr:type VI secretion system ImpA family N-terminal domain-containing protein [Candidatus Solibacter sp.]